MALHLLGTNAANSLVALTYAPDPTDLLPADIGNFAQGIVDDAEMGAGLVGGPTPGGIEVIACTGTTHNNTTLDTLVQVAGGPLASVRVGMLVLGIGIPVSTYVAAILSATSVQLSRAATTGAGGTVIVFAQPKPRQENLSYNGQLVIPRRGILRVFPGDIIAKDQITGWPILVSPTAVSTPGSQWTYA